MADRTPVIVGIGLSDYPMAPDLDGVQHHVAGDAAGARRLRASPSPTIDGYCRAGGGGDAWSTTPSTMAEYLGIDHRYIDGTMTGGSSFEFHVQHAAAAIRDGLCDTILVTYGSDQLSRMGRMLGTGGFRRGRRTVAGPDPVRGAVRQLARRLLRDGRAAPHARVRHDVGAARRDRRRRARVRRAQPARHVPRPDHRRRRAQLADDRRPAAQARLLRDLRRRRRDRHDHRGAGPGPAASRRSTCSAPAGAQTHWNIGQMPDFTTSAGGRASRADAFARGRPDARRRRHDPVLRQLHDHRAAAARGHRASAPKGEGGAFVAGGPPAAGRAAAAQHRRRRPVVAATPACAASSCSIEAVRQLRGQAGEAQVPDGEVALACGSGGWLSCIGAVAAGEGAPA